MSQEPQNPNTDQWRDQLVARALEERLGGESPPDLSAQILSAATEADPSTTGDVTMATTTVSRSWNVRSWVLAASVLVNCGLIAALLASRTSDEYALAANQAANEPRAAGKSSVEGLERNAAKDDYGVIVRDGGQANEDFNDSLDILASTVEIESGGDRSAQGNLNGVNLNTLGTSGEGQQGGGQVPPPAADSLSWQAKDEPIALYDEAQQDAGQGQAADRSSGGEEAAAIGSGRLRSGYYMQDDVQFFAPEAEVQLAKEAAAMDGLGRGRGVEQEYSMEAATRKYSITRGPRDETAAVPDHKVRFGVNADAGVTEFAGGVEEPSRNKSFDSYDVELAGIPQPSEPPIVYPDSNVWADLATERPTWGYAGANGRRWPRDNNIGEPGLLNPNAEWHGSPDGEGLGPGAPGDQYERIHENRFIAAIGEEAVSTFSIDVDTASYANVRQMLVNGQVPPPDAVRLEELVNYFDYDYEPPAPTPSPASGGGEESVPFAAHVETAACPWQPGHRLVRVGIKGREIAAEKRPLSNLVFLVDVSGSMNNPEKLPLVKHGLKKLAEKLGENDRVAIVVYASSEGLALPSTPGTEQETILAALEHLQAGGSTAGGAGIQLAYQIAEDNFITGGTNRVILCTDGDFNVGVTNTAELERMVEQKAKDTKVFLSCIGFGRGNLNDAMMEKITGIGNGNYYYADDEREAERIFVQGMTGMLVTIAKDVKIQVEFNPAKVLGYRLLGYENRMLKTEDFNDDTKDAGEIGAGHTVTCLYEIVPTGEAFQEPDVDELKYQHPSGLTDAAETDELLTLKMRYKQPDEDTSSKLEWPVTDSGHSFGQASTDMQFAAAVASFGMLLRNSQYKGNANYDAVIEIADSTKGDDPEGDRAEFVELVRKAKQVMPPPIPPETEADPEPAVEPEAEADNPSAEDAPAEDDVEAPSDQ
ncbi:vWA domain-containing protein [Aeoliella sp.]|uniref:vWA domain-containing protein n=1 Tax=Aeoliella sp. TaxID=2795800 RepID=UPI003CCBA1BE